MARRLLKAYVAQWREWLEDWIMERRVLAVEEEEDAEVKAAGTGRRKAHAGCFGACCQGMLGL